MDDIIKELSESIQSADPNETTYIKTAKSYGRVLTWCLNRKLDCTVAGDFDQDIWMISQSPESCKKIWERFLNLEAHTSDPKILYVKKVMQHNTLSGKIPGKKK